MPARLRPTGPVATGELIDLRDPRPAGGVARGSATRLAGTLAYAGFTAATGVLTARAFGAADKGTLATLSYLAATASIVATAGLGDALVVRGRGSPPLLRAGAGPMVRATAAGGALMAPVATAAAVLVLGSRAPGPLALALAVATVPLLATAHNLGRLADGASRQAATASAQTALAGVTAAVTLVLVTVAGGGFTAALVAMVLGATASNAVHASWLARGPRAAGTAVERPSVRAGVPFMVAALTRTLWSRLDLLVVYVLAGPRSAGVYSVAITVGEVALYPAAALAAGMFGAVARAGDDAPVLRARFGSLARTAAVVSAGFGLALAVLAPIALPAAFGREFAGSVTPALILVAASVPASVQWVVARAAAARGVPVLGVRTMALGLAVMVGIDVALGSHLTPTRAALAALAGSCVAAAGALRGSSGLPSLPWRDAVPRRADLAAVLGSLRDLRRR